MNSVILVVLKSILPTTLPIMFLTYLGLTPVNILVEIVLLLLIVHIPVMLKIHLDILSAVKLILLTVAGVIGLFCLALPDEDNYLKAIILLSVVGILTLFIVVRREDVNYCL